MWEGYSLNMLTAEREGGKESRGEWEGEWEGEKLGDREIYTFLFYKWQTEDKDSCWNTVFLIAMLVL